MTVCDRGEGGVKKPKFSVTYFTDDPIGTTRFMKSNVQRSTMLHYMRIDSLCTRLLLGNHIISKIHLFPLLILSVP